MILALDMGNTNIVLGGIDENDIYFVSRVVTDRRKTGDEYAVIFNSILDLYNVDRSTIDGAIISSVVPPLTKIIKHAIEHILGITPMVVGPGVKTGLNILIDNPAQLGSDLVVDAVAATAEYPAPLIIFDMGTATTVSVIDKNKNYLGGVIIPGIMVSQESLTSKTSQLPRIGLDEPEKVIGRNTVECMRSGLYNANASMIDGMIERVEGELGMSATVIATGGLSKFIVPYCKREIIYDDSLLLKGLWIIYKKNVK